MSFSSPYKSVRALTRGLALLEELSRNGGSRPAQLARATGIDRTTAYRLIATLEEAGLVRENSDSGEYVLTGRVRDLSDGFTERDRVSQVVNPHLGRLFHQVLWPTDFATFDRGAMVIRETTHSFSPYSVHRAMVGKPRSLLVSALGRAALAGATSDQRSTMIEIMQGQAEAERITPTRMDELIKFLLSDFARRGYAYSVGGSDKRISAIAVPIDTGTQIAAAVNLVFFSSAMSVEVAAKRFLAPLKQCAADIENSLLEMASAAHPTVATAHSGSTTP